MTEILKIKDLHVSVEETEILKGIDLEINSGEVHVIMGSNGSGKSTLMNAIMANPGYNVTSGDIIYKGENINDWTTDKRARAGIFMSFQTPDAIPGEKLGDFLRQAKDQVSGERPSILKFNKEIKKEIDSLKIDEGYANRYVNVGFSGGERKKSEILQLKTLNPTLAMLDETDSGLDVDAVRIVSKGIQDYI